MKVAIIGAGITGLSIGLHLAERGAAVVICERTGVGAEASGVQPGGVRQQWGTRINCELARESLAFFRHVAERLEAPTTPRLDECGYVFLAHSDERRRSLESDVALQNDVGVPSRILGPAELGEIVDGLDVATVVGAAYCPEDGYFDQPQAVVESFASTCRRHGVAIEQANVLSLRREASGWALDISGGGTVGADAVVLAAGYDTPTLARSIGIELPIVKEARYLLLSEPIRERLVEPLVVSTELRLAVKQLANGRMLASDLAAAGDPGSHARAWRANVKKNSTTLLPLLEFVSYPLIVEGFYDLTPDHQPVLGEVPGHEGLWIAAGFSGHGFMMAPAVGRIMAEALLEGQRHRALDEFSYERFEYGNLIPELQIV